MTLHEAKDLLESLSPVGMDPLEKSGLARRAHAVISRRAARILRFVTGKWKKFADTRSKIQAPSLAQSPRIQKITTCDVVAHPINVVVSPTMRHPLPEAIRGFWTRDSKFWA